MFKKTSQPLATTQNDTSDLRGIITYMNIFSAAGMVTHDQMTSAAFLTVANKYVGQWIVMSAHPCIDSSGNDFNSLILTMQDGNVVGSTTSSDNSDTHILCFEYFKYLEPVSIPDLVGKNVRFGGILEAVEKAPANSEVWISRLHISRAFARIITPG